MTILFITGLSGVGKTSVLSELKSRGHKTVDLDYGYIIYKNNERFFDKNKINRLLDDHQETNLILAGTESNQGQFYHAFDEVILLTADLGTMLDRLQTRTTNPYGKTEEERAEVIETYETVLPLLRKRAILVIDSTSRNPQDIADQLEDLL
jgi:broad-specificity NMP kinase